MILAAVLAMACAAGARAQSDGSGKDAFNFLGLELGARATAMGGAYAALADDPYALVYNPAGLARVPREEASFMHNAYFAGVSQDYLGYAGPWGLGAYVNSLSYGAIAQTTLSQPGGTGSQTAPTAMAGEIGYGHFFFDRLSLGGGVKYAEETIAGTALHAWGLDGGALFAPGGGLKGLTLGAAVQNVGGSQDPLPLSARAGAAYAFPWEKTVETASVDEVESQGGYALRAGFEAALFKAFALRAGWVSGQIGGGFSGGAGVSWKDWILDYAFVPMGELGSVNQVSLSLHWGREGRPRWTLPSLIRRAHFHAPPAEGTVEWHFEIADRLMDEAAGADDPRLKDARYQMGKAAALLGPHDPRRLGYDEAMGRLSALEGKPDRAREFYAAALRLNPPPERRRAIREAIEKLSSR